MHETVQEAGRTGGKFWVYLPSYANRDEAVKQSAALKDKGFDNYIVNTEGENKTACPWACSRKKTAPKPWSSA